MADTRVLAASPVNGDEYHSRTARLMNAAKEGSREALDELVEELTPALWHAARAAGLSQPDAEDVVQTAWLTMVTHLHTIRTPEALKSWLLTTTKREAWRVRASGRMLRPADDEWLASFPDPDAGAEERMIVKDERRQLLDAFLALPPRCQELLRLVAFEPRPDYNIVASLLGVPRGSIGPTRSRCLGKLRGVLDGSGDLR